jgi:tyrosyl-tRNA synthetase
MDREEIIETCEKIISIKKRDMDYKNKEYLILNDLHEVMISKNILSKILQKRALKVYWGTAPTGKIHIGYLLGLRKIKDMIKAGCEITILIADLHAVLDNLKSNEKQVGMRTEYYTRTIKLLLESMGVDISKINFVIGSSYQYSPEFTKDIYRLMSITRVGKASHCGAEVVKHDDNPLLSSLIYPYMQILDEIYLKTDAQLGGLDQRKIFTEAKEILPKIGYTTPRIHFMNKMLPSINSHPKNSELKMSASDSNNKIDVYDTPKNIKKKIMGAYCLEGDSKTSSLFDLLEYVIFPLLNFTDFIIFRDDKYGGTLKYKHYWKLVEDFNSKLIHPTDLKNSIAEFFISFLSPLQKYLESNPEFKKLIDVAYKE